MIEFEIADLVREVWANRDALRSAGLNEELPDVLPRVLIGAASKAERDHAGAGLRLLGGWSQVVGVGEKWNGEHWLGGLSDVLRCDRLHDYLNAAHNPIAYVAAAVWNRVRERHRDAEKRERHRQRALQQWHRRDSVENRSHGDANLIDHEGINRRLTDTMLRDLPGTAVANDTLLILTEAVARIRSDLPPDQAKYLRLREAGLSAAEAIRRVGRRGWSPHISVTAKLRRQLRAIAG